MFYLSAANLGPGRHSVGGNSDKKSQDHKSFYVQKML